jgi:plasmid stabilization system protein ParE
MKVVWSPLAEQRALEAVEYIGQDRPRTAAVWLERLLACVGPCGSRRRITFRYGHAVRHC